jgi:hypothetical protein
MALGLKDLNITPHPVLPAPDDGMVAALLAQPGGEEKLANYLVDREGHIQRERDDPFSFGWEPDNWADADDLVGKFDEVLINGGNRADSNDAVLAKTRQLIKEELQGLRQSVGEIVRNEINNALQNTVGKRKPEPRSQEHLIRNYLPPPMPTGY